MSHPSVCLIVCGGIAASKAPELVRLLKARGISVRVIMTKAAREFVTPLTLATLSGEEVFDDLFSLTHEVTIGHIALARGATAILVCAATANFIAKMAHGFADDLASTVILAAERPVLLAPAMNVRMWHHKATQRNIAQVKADGVHLVGPVAGDMACGEHGLGRMAEPGDIVAALMPLLPDAAKDNNMERLPLRGKHVLITAGPTHEAIDGVRYIANHSSGKQGIALAQAALEAGARVTLVLGPVAISPPSGVALVRVESARDMMAACLKALPADVFIANAAVSDFRVKSPLQGKIKKSAQKEKNDYSLMLELVENPDILHTIATHDTLRPCLVVGFAAEVEALEARSAQKRLAKGCDLLIANKIAPVYEAGKSVFGAEENEVLVFGTAKMGLTDPLHLPPQAKLTLARAIVKLCTQMPEYITQVAYQSHFQ